MKIIIASVLAIVLIVLLISCNRVWLSEDSAGMIKYKIDGVTLTDELTADEVSAVVSVLDGKKMGPLGIKCGFDSDVAVVIDGKTFLPCPLGHPQVKVQDKSKHIMLSDEEFQIFMDIFSSRGATLGGVPKR